MKKNVILLLILFVVSLGLSYVFFTYVMPFKRAIVITPPQKLASGGLGFDQTLPKTQPCPLNGVLYSTQQEAWWQKHRPLGVMIENHQEARPQSGISFADVVYEAVAEGGITRFLTVFYCNDAPQVGPVRSARTYFVDFISEYADYPLYAHVGGANASGPADALGQIDGYGWTGYNDLNQFSIGFPTYWRDYDRLGHTVATEHTMYSTTTKLWDVGASRGLTNVDKQGKSWDTNFVKYTFKEDAPLAQRGSVTNIHIPFWQDTDYAVDWHYDKQTNLFMRSNGGQPHLDLDTKKQLSAKNVVILYMVESNADDGYENNIHLLYQDKGTGKAAVFMDGKQIPALWKKASRTARTLLFDTNGNPIVFDRGVIWFEIISTTTDVTVK